MPGTDLLKYFKYDHLPERLQPTSKIFKDAVRKVINNVPTGEERDMAIRKLLEAKDCAVRAMIGLG